MHLIKKILHKSEQEKNAKDFFPILLMIIITSGLLLILASYLAKIQA
ncbi:MAG: hypothetical protein ABH896_03275 [Candidatus Jacksonbacteria bacterium]